jgi:hypothetical protein
MYKNKILEQRNFIMRGIHGNSIWFGCRLKKSQKTIRELILFYTSSLNISI